KKELLVRRVRAFALELIPRISRAQSMDVLSSQASIAGYKAAVLAASRLPKYFPMLMTAAGAVQPARVLVLGAGVAGLQAIATARRLGAVVEAFDVRRATKEQVESLGARFIELEGLDAEGEGGYARELTEEEQARLKALVAERTAEADVVITTAQIPGRRAPILVEEETVRRMRPGSVIVDLAAASGGNCPLSKPDEEVVVNGVLILGPTNLPATMPVDASRLFARNALAFVSPMVQEGALAVPEDDEIYQSALLCAEGRPNRGEFFKEA
ncbi:MAG: NAD(P) transhydrogenase subunit alpha, partial [Zetaproteobacteria bacterium]